MTRKFALWLGATTLSALGDGVLYFALAWTATGIGAQVAGLMFTLTVLPRTLLMLLGGAVGDRYGLRRTLIACDAAMCLLLIGYLVTADLDVSPLVPLWILVLGWGVVSAFSMPASGAMPRLFVTSDVLPRAMSTTGSMLQVARLTGPPLGGVIVGALAVTGAVTADLASCAVILVVLACVRPPYEPPPPEHGEPTLRRIAEGLRAARDVPGVVPMLAAVALVAGSLIPMLSLCVPLTARERGWSAGETGLVETAWIVGTLGVSLLVARVGTRKRPLGALVVGPFVAALGVVVMSVSTSLPVGLTGAWVMGVGTATFTSHVFPAYMLKTPDGMLARFQALLGVVQAAPMLVSNNVFAFIAEKTGPSSSLLTVAGVCLLASVVVASSGEMRRLRVGQVEPEPESVPAGSAS